MTQIYQSSMEKLSSIHWITLSLVRVLSIVRCQSAEGEIATPTEELSLVDAEPEVTIETEPAEDAPDEVKGTSMNSDWDPLTDTFDGVEMVQVPPGCFMMGDAKVERAQPVHEVCITETYWIDKTEVSNAQFQELGGSSERESSYPGYEISGDDQPRTSVTWDEAQSFCQLRGGRLPTEAEWEYAARGPEAWLYPWGNEYDPTRLNVCDSNCKIGGSAASDLRTADDGYAVAAPVDSFPDGASWVGALNMAGNMAEWVADWYGENYYSEAPRENPGGPESGTNRVVKSIPWSWYIDLDLNTQLANRWNFIPDATGNDYSGATGFRCVLSDS